MRQREKERERERASNIQKQREFKDEKRCWREGEIGRDKHKLDIHIFAKHFPCNEEYKTAILAVLGEKSEKSKLWI